MSSTETEAEAAPNVSDVDLRQTLQRMDADEFEEFVADLWERKGWDAEVEGGTNDRGVDVRCTKPYPYEQKLLIQAKRYGPGTTVGSPEIQQYASLAHQEGQVDKVLVVTTNGFSRQALELSHDLNVKTIDGDQLVHVIREEDALDLVAEYAPALEADSGGLSSGLEPQEEDGETGVRERLSATRSWVARLSVLWVAGFAVAMVAPGDVLTAIGGLAVLIAWIGVPLAIARDGRSVSRHTEWSPWWPFYTLGALIPAWAPLVGGLYLLRRRGKVNESDG